MFIRQRFRWTFGIMQSFWKHHDLLFNTKKSNIGWILLPNLLIFQLLLPLFSPIIDIMFVLSLFSNNAFNIILFYLGFFIIDCGISMLAFHFDNQKFNLSQASLLFVQRFVYRQFLFYVLIKSYIKALKGELALWGILKRTGNVKQE
jgi:hypothetical protein